MNKVIETLHAVKRRWFRNWDLEKLPIIGTVRQQIIKRSIRDYVDGIHGHRMYLDRLDTFGLSWHKTFEILTTDLIQQIIKPGMTVVDVGASIGYHTLLFAAAVGPKGRVFAFEPDATSYSLLEKNVRLNGYKNVVTAQKAVMDRADVVHLHLSQENLGDHRVAYSGEGRQSVIVDAVCLDDFLESAGSIDFVKIDVQGVEPRVLKGMERIIKENPGLTLLIEFSLGTLLEAGEDPRTFFNELCKFGYQIIELDDLEGVVRQESYEAMAARLNPKTDRNVNLFCTKSSIPQWVQSKIG